MNVASIKQYIYDNDLIESILDSIDCHHIKKRDGYYTCGNYNGDNPNAIVCYENENLSIINYTRQMAKNKRATDLFDLVMYNRDCTFPEALKFVCDMFGLDIYDEPEEQAYSLQLLQLFAAMKEKDDQEENIPLKPISEKILDYYLPYGNKQFENDNISLSIQSEFEIGYDPQTNYITIPLRDNIGSLVGVKARWLGEVDGIHSRYFFLEKCAKGKMLYGYWQNRMCIKNNNRLFVCESEKGVLQLASLGVRNAVAIGSKTISHTQVELITRTGCTPVFAFDKDVQEDELASIADMFMPNIRIEAIIDRDNLLTDKESPSDNPTKWTQLVQNHIYKIK